ncbi:queuosine precursor transporter [Candidatus Pacebacteria bacterium]|nr:queuosine precursor transporter [Candidatus Paceibacterota bacterium]
MNVSAQTILIATMALVVVASNILVQFLLGNWLTWAAFTYPLAFVVTDIANRLYGTRVARKIVLYGFLIGVICSLIAAQLTTVEGFPLTTLRIAIGSGVAFVVAQLIDVQVFSSLRTRVWWQAPLVSSVVGSVIDTALFFSIAFSSYFIFIHPMTDVGWANEIVPLLGIGASAPLWVSLAMADFGAKMVVALAGLFVFRWVTSTAVYEKGRSN